MRGNQYRVLNTVDAYIDGVAVKKSELTIQQFLTFFLYLFQFSPMYIPHSFSICEIVLVHAGIYS